MFEYPKLKLKVSRSWCFGVEPRQSVVLVMWFSSPSRRIFESPVVMTVVLKLYILSKAAVRVLIDTRRIVRILKFIEKLYVTEIRRKR